MNEKTKNTVKKIKNILVKIVSLLLKTDCYNNLMFKSAYMEMRKKEGNIWLLLSLVL